MHRSITLSELLSSTFSNDVQEDNNGVKKMFIARVAIGIIEFFTSSLFMSYGILFSQYVDKGIYNIKDGLWTTIIYMSIWNITGPIIKSFNLTFFNEGKRFRLVVIISAVCLAIAMVLPGHIIPYGIFGGFFSKFIYLHIKAVAKRCFNIHDKIYEANIQCAKAISLLIMPHLLLFIVDYYPVEQGRLIYSAILLNIIPAALILKPPKNRKPINEDPELSRYSTLPGLSHQMREMVDFTDSNYTSDISYTDIQYPIEDDLLYDELENNNNRNDFNENQVEELPQRAPLISSAVQDYFSKAGVAILPEIPEEREVDDDIAVVNNYIDPKRLSMISAKLEELQQNDKPEEVEVMNINDLILKHNRSTDNIQNIEYIPNYRGSSFFSHIEMTTIPCCSCPTHKIFSWKRKIRNCKDIVCDYVFKPFCDFYLYPIILTKFSTTLVSTLFITLAPYFASKKNEGFKREDTAFLLSYLAFSWCLFLLLLPLVVTFSEKKLRGSFICGLFITGSSMILLWKKIVPNDFITLNCLLYGFGYGMVTFTENFVYKQFVGVRRWKLLEGSLEILSAILMTFTYYIIYIYDIDLITLLPPVAFCVYSINAVIWLSIPVCKKINKIIKGRYKDSRVAESFLTF